MPQVGRLLYGGAPSTMKYQLATLAIAQLAAAKAGPWEQCGGQGWSGDTTCVDGYHCQSSNPSGEAATTMTTAVTTTAATTSDSTGPTSNPGSCSGSFDDISAQNFVDAMNPGWNLGNTLDAIPDEGSWNNAPAQGSVFDDVKAAGFKSVRIPVTYKDHFVSQAPDYKVDPEWLQRVSDVIDLALERDLYVITNVHHDSTDWADVSASGADIEALQDKFYALWLQIATQLACKSSMVAFESINEPPVTTAQDAAEVNELNAIFVKALADAGGFNTDRVVILSGGGNDAFKTSQWFEPPSDFQNPWALQFHFYNPYDFTFGAWGKTIWGSDADKAAVDTEFGVMRGNFTDVPLLVGEFDASPANTEPAARWKWTDYVVRAANKIDASVVLWDNGADHLDRDEHQWRDPTSIEIIIDAAAGESNSLPDSTTDASATEQSTSAFIFHHAGDDVSDHKLPWLFNGNTLKSIVSEDGKLSSDAYTVGDSSITFKADWISSQIESSPGVYDTLTLSFSEGADVEVKLVVWDTPVLGATSSTAVGGSDLVIPVEYNGLHRLATVKMVGEDGTYLVDDWTKWLGPLQQARGTYEGQWKFTDDSVIITSYIVDLVIASGQPATFTFEFFPRVEGNSVEYTLNV